MKRWQWVWAGAAAAVAMPALAQYKVVGPDGKVTYTDRPPVTEPGQVTPMKRGVAPAAAAGADASLPFELRQVASRFPVTLYTSTTCNSCDAARQLLAARGVPYAERRIVSNEDIDALARLTGGRSVPSLLVGSQPTLGFSSVEWDKLLDLAGYPRESRLPRGWQPPPVTPLTTPPAAPAAASAPERTPARATPPAPPAADAEVPGRSPIRF
jgi:glutaredoxin